MSKSWPTQWRWLLIVAFAALASIVYLAMRDPAAALASDLSADLPLVVDDNTQLVAVVAVDNRLELQIQRNDVRADALTPDKFSDLMQQLVPVACLYAKRHAVIDSGLQVQYRLLMADSRQLPAFDIALSTCNVRPTDIEKNSEMAKKQN